MCAVERGVHRAFWEEVRGSGNTVCGRHPIGVVMAALEGIRDGEEGKGGGGGMGEGQRGEEGKEQGMEKGRFKFVRYERSGEVTSVKDSSVSYASALAVL